MRETVSETLNATLNATRNATRTLTLKLNLQHFAWDDVDSNGSGTDIEYFKLASGQKARIRILDEEPFSRWTHWLPKQQRTITCVGKNCPICAVLKAQKANGETTTYNSSRRHIMHIWNYETKRIEFFEQGNEVFKSLSAYHKLLGDIRSADITIIRQGTGKDTTYTLMPAQATPIDKDIASAYEETKVNFSERLKAPEMEDVKKLMTGASFEEVFGTQEATNETKDENVSFEVAE